MRAANRFPLTKRLVIWLDAVRRPISLVVIHSAGAVPSAAKVGAGAATTGPPSDPDPSATAVNDGNTNATAATAIKRLRML